jgi:hypothetical protein
VIFLFFFGVAGKVAKFVHPDSTGKTGILENFLGFLRFSEDF